MVDFEEHDVEERDAHDDEHIEKKKPERWYTVQVASGCENKVQSTLMQRAIALDVQDRIIEVVIPKRPGYKMGKDGKRQQIQEKIFPGYVLVRMVLDDEAWQVVKSTPNVINFVGNEERRLVGRGRGHVVPRPLSAAEVQRIFKTAEVEETTVQVDMAEGDKIEVLSGPFQGFHGEVIEVSPDRGKLKALISIFGRDTPVELEFNQVEKEV